MTTPLYQMVEWPEVQALMDEPWFDDEAILINEDNVPPSTYLIPEDRLNGKGNSQTV